MRSTRARACRMAAGDRRSSSAGCISTVLVMFALSVLVFLIFFATPGVDPAARIAGRNADPQTLEQVRHDFGLDRPLAVQYAIMMKKLFVTRDLTSFVNRGAQGHPADRRRRARDALARLRRRPHLGGGVDSRGHCRGGHARHVRGSAAHGDRADRHLDAGVLAGRGGQPASRRAACTRSCSRGCHRSATRRSRRTRRSGSST